MQDPTAPIKKIIKSLPVSFQIFFILHCKSNNGMARGTANPHTTSS